MKIYIYYKIIKSYRNINIGNINKLDQNTIQLKYKKQIPKYIDVQIIIKLKRKINIMNGR